MPGGTSKQLMFSMHNNWIADRLLSGRSFMLSLALYLLVLPCQASAVGFVVTRVDDPATGACVVNDCSLREAVIAANLLPGPDTITVPAGTYYLTLGARGEDAAMTGDLDITDDVVITGAGALVTIIDPDYADRAFHVIGLNVTARIDGFTLQHGNSWGGHGGALRNDMGTVYIDNCILTENRAVRPPSEDGGAIENYQGNIYIFNSTISYNIALDDGGGIENDQHQGQRGIMTLVNSSVIGNVAMCGGGIDNDDIFTIINSTISDNTAGDCPNPVVGGGGGGIRHNEDTTPSSSVLTIINSTIVRNHADYGGGISNDPSRNSLFTLQNTIVAENTASIQGADCMGEITSLGNNLIGTVAGCTFTAAAADQLEADPGLADFVAPTGAGTGHFPLLVESAAIDAGDNTICPENDQLFAYRPVDFEHDGNAVCDIGAVEMDSPSVEVIGLSPTGLFGLMAALFGGQRLIMRRRRGF